MVLVQVKTEVVEKQFIGYSITPFSKWMLVPKLKDGKGESLVDHLVQVKLREMFPGAHLNPVTISY